jgi:hypothetical protein
MLTRAMGRSLLARWLATMGAALAAAALAYWSVRHTAPPAGPTPGPAPEVKVCAERLQKLGRALALYAGDHDGAFPVLPTPDHADKRLPALPAKQKVTPDVLRCPTSEPSGPPYVYHCYRKLGPGEWPRWMAPKHRVTQSSPPGTWLAADHVRRDDPGPHSATEKAFNYLTVDGRVTFRVGRPREVYR